VSCDATTTAFDSDPICEIVALRKNFVDRLRESYDANKAKSCVFIAHENMQAILHLFPIFVTQPAQKNGMKNLSTNLISQYWLTAEIF
jgi:hypothetical protein